MAVLPATEAQAFIDEIVAAGNELALGSPGPGSRPRYRRLLSAAQYHGLVPDGLRLRYTGRDSGEMTIRLVPDTPENEPVQPKPPDVPVPSRLPKSPHPFVEATRRLAQERAKSRYRSGPWVATGGRDTFGLKVTPANVTRALLILQAVCDEAERRGYEIGRPPEGGKRTVGVVILGHHIALSVTQEYSMVKPEPDPSDRWEKAAQPVPRDNLRLLRDNDFDHDPPPLANDRKRWRIEDRLGHAFERLEATAEALERRRLEKIRAAEELDERKAVAITEAIEMAYARRRVVELDSRLDDWDTANRLRRFLTAARSTDRTGTERAWLDWVESKADEIDPLCTDLAPAPEVQLRSSDLSEFLPGWVRAGEWSTVDLIHKVLDNDAERRFPTFSETPDRETNC